MTVRARIISTGSGKNFLASDYILKVELMRFPMD